MTFKEGEVHSPDRYFIDIAPARLNSFLTGKEWTIDSRLVQKIRVAQFDASTVRIVLDGPTMKNVTASELERSEPNCHGCCITDNDGPTEDDHHHSTASHRRLAINAACPMARPPPGADRAPTDAIAARCTGACA